jgi:Protein of unknown function (DUF3102)
MRRTVINRHQADKLLPPGIIGSNSLPELAHRINEEHAAVARAVTSALEHAILCGKLLCEAKEKIDQHGKWLPWLETNCPSLPRRTASHYMRLWKSRNTLIDEMGNVAHLTVRQALQLLVPVDDRVLPETDNNEKYWQQLTDAVSILLVEFMPKWSEQRTDILHALRTAYRNSDPPELIRLSGWFAELHAAYEGRPS